MKIKLFTHKKTNAFILSCLFSIISLSSIQALDFGVLQSLEFLTAFLRSSASKLECELLTQQDKSKETFKQLALISGLRSIHDVIAAYNHPSDHSFGYLEGFALYDAGQTLKHFRDAFTLIEGPLDTQVSTDIQSKDSSEQHAQLTKTLLRTTILPEIEGISGTLLSFHGQANTHEVHVLLLKALLTFSRLCQIALDQDPGITKNVAFGALVTHIVYTLYNFKQLEGFELIEDNELEPQIQDPVQNQIPAGQNQDREQQDEMRRRNRGEQVGYPEFDEMPGEVD